MLVTRRGDHLTLIPQPEHARLAGQLGEVWGNDRFTIPEPRQALICAATHHDDGWHELDSEPAYNPEAQRPANFVELPLERTVGPYSRGVESVYERDLHAGVLVSMHFSGFYTARWGIAGGSAVDHPLAREAVATQEARWMPALREAWGYRGPRSQFDAHTWHAYEVLQALDVISLALGLTDLSQPSGHVPPVTATSTLGLLDPPPGARIVPAVPLAAGGQRVGLVLRVVAPYRVHVDPFPFARSEIALTLVIREMPDRLYASAQEAASVYHEAPPQELSIQLAAG